MADASQSNARCGDVVGLDGRTWQARRVRALVAMYTNALGGSPDALTAEAIQRAAELQVTAEWLRTRSLRGEQVHPGDLVKESPQSNDGFMLGNDEDQAAQDLSLAKKLVAVNADEIGGEVDVLSTEIKRRDGGGSLQILPARNAIGQHGKTALFIGFDEI